jgi:hypothetical protein
MLSSVSTSKLTMPKRKADEGDTEDDDSVPADASSSAIKVSRRVLLAAAKERARAAMASDKAKVQAVQKKKSAVAVAASAITRNKSNPKKVAAQSKPATPGPPNKRRRKEPEGEPASTPNVSLKATPKKVEQAEKSAVLRSPEPKKTEAQPPNLRHASIPAQSSLLSPTLSAPSINAPGMMNPMTTQGISGVPMNYNEYGMMPQSYGGSSFGGGYGGASYASGTSPYAFAPDIGAYANAARTSNMGQQQLLSPSLSAPNGVPSGTFPQFPSGPRSGGELRQNVRTTLGSEGEDDVPPPPTLQAQISQQVLGNCAASFHNRPLPFKQPPPEAFDQSNQEVEEDEDEEVLDEERIYIENDSFVDGASDATPVAKSQGTNWLLVSLLVGFLSSCLLWPIREFKLLKVNMDLVDVSPLAVCYFDSANSDYDEPTVQCGENAAVCPADAICEFGRLVSCSLGHYEVSQSGEMCVLTQQTNESIATLQSLLVDWTVKDQCGDSPSEPYPLFDYSKLQLVKPLELSPERLSLALVQQQFVVELQDDGIWVGLPDDHSLSYSPGCRMSRFLKFSLSWCGSQMVAFAHRVAKLVWTCLSAYPLTSLIGLILVLAAHRRRSYLAHRSRVLRDIAHLRQLAYEYLQDVPNQAHVVLHIRDEIAMSLYPDSKAKRAYIIKQVWPRVVPDVQLDNRIRKTTRIVDGNPQDVWQWVAVRTRNATPS